MKYLTYSFCLVLVAAGAVVHGATTHRWQSFGGGNSRAETMHAYLVQVGDFQATEIPSDLPLKEKSVGTNRQYFSPSRGESIVVSLTSGPPGAVSTHTPDVCYPSSGYKVVKEPVRKTIDLPDGRIARYYVAEFEKKSASKTERHRVRWSWTVEGNWDAPDHVRFVHLNAAELYKIYVVTSVPTTEENRTDEETPAVKRFMAETFAQYAGLLAR